MYNVQFERFCEKWLFGRNWKNGRLLADYQIILNAAGWHEKGVLTEDDLSEINQAMENYVPEVTTENE